MKYALAPEVKKDIKVLVEKLAFTHIIPSQVYCIRSFDAKTRAIARIWGMAPLFHEVADVPVTYIVEVVSKRYDKLVRREQIKTLIHELMHIPKTFSGALLCHRGRYHRINDREVERILKNLK